MDISKLEPGDNHYMAYVGPPLQYDFMGATQFRLLCTLGLRAHHHMLDVGCGSLRAGRFFISYLDQGRYFGIEPNAWLVDEGIKNQLGRDLVDIKKPSFDYGADFDAEVFLQKFDFIVAQSVFSHSGGDLIALALRKFKGSLKSNGFIVLTFIEGGADYSGSGWIYPDCVSYRPSTIKRFAQEAGLHIARIPWYHPRQVWYVLTNDENRLPDSAMMRYLSGAVLFDSDFSDSWERGGVVRQIIKGGLRKVRCGLSKLLFGRENNC